MEGGLIRLRAILNVLTPSERKIAQYIVDHPEQIVQASVAQLSEWSGGSSAAIIRLCKSLGVSGFQELKLKVAGDLIGQNKLEYNEIQPYDSMQSIINSVSANHIQSIEDTMKILDPELIEKAVEAILRANRVFFYGMGASNLIATDAQYKFLRINKTCFSFGDPHIQVSSATTLKEDDTVIGISYSGETEHVVSCLKLAQARGATTISITKLGNNSLCEYSHIPLMTSSTENEIRSGATSSRITQLNVIDILYLGVVSRNYDASITYLEKSRRAVHGKE
jgi:DNA-binding MurR/RpiR family transcriptional regulator